MWDAGENPAIPLSEGAKVVSLEFGKRIEKRSEKVEWVWKSDV
jgi:hypothetical protein